ncbi:MAG: heme biosynthesis HemY N-terminal domain-containing protein [Pseudomonadota bacterium]
MIRALFVFLFFLALFTVSVFFAMQQTGFASLRFGDTEYTVNLVNFVIGIFILLPLLYIFFKLVGLLFNAPKLIHDKMSSRRHNKALKDTQHGLTKFIQGDWVQSEKLLLRGAENSKASAINYIWAACAAHQRGDFTERDAHLAAAKNANPDETATLDVLQAEMLLEQNMPEQALASLSKHSDAIRSNSKIATLFSTAYEQLQDWDRLASIIPQLKNAKNLDAQHYSHIVKQALKGLLKTQQNNADEIGTKHKDALLADGELTVEYVSALRQQGKHELAESISSTSLNTNWNSKLAHQYGLIEFKDAGAVLSKAEKWAEQHTDDENLYLSLGRICKQAQLWGKAKAYFESSLSRKPLAETYAELSSLHEQLDEHDDAHRCAKKGLQLATNKL